MSRKLFSPKSGHEGTLQLGAQLRLQHTIRVNVQYYPQEGRHQFAIPREMILVILVHLSQEEGLLLESHPRSGGLHPVSHHIRHAPQQLGVRALLDQHDQVTEEHLPVGVVDEDVDLILDQVDTDHYQVGGRDVGDGSLSWVSWQGIEI